MIINIPQNKKALTTYAVVIVLYNQGKGGHVLYAKNIVPRIQDRFNRLWNEVEYSLQVANHLVNNGIQKPKFIDIDLNPDPKYKSNQVLRAALSILSLKTNTTSYPLTCLSTSYT